MLASFADAATQQLWETGRCRRLPPSLERSAFRKLAILNAAMELPNLRVPPGNRLEALQGDR